MTQKKWPSDYPSHLTLPPEDSYEVNDNLFRAVANDPPNASDFLGSYKDPLQKHRGRNEKTRNSPAFYGTSFFSTYESIHDIIEGNPERFSGQKIAEGHVKPEHGKGHRAKRSFHVSVWFYEGVYPEGFKVL